MSIATDTDALLTVWGETVTIRRNTPTYGDIGELTDSWATLSTPLADVQPVDAEKAMVTVAIGEQRILTHRIFFPDATAIRAGDRIRRASWASGDDELEVQYVMTDEGHVEVYTSAVAGHA